MGFDCRIVDHALRPELFFIHSFQLDETGSEGHLRFRNFFAFPDLREELMCHSDPPCSNPGFHSYPQRPEAHPV